MRNFFILILIFSNVYIAQAQHSVTENCSEETEERNKALARHFYEKVWFSNNPEVVDEVFAPEYVVHDIGDRKGVTEAADEQKKIAVFFWHNGKLSGNIDYQIADCDIVATRWQGKFTPESWWMKMIGFNFDIPIINVFRFQDGKIVEIWNHRHDIDSFQGTFEFIKGLLIGVITCLILPTMIFLFWRKQKRTFAMTKG